MNKNELIKLCVSLADDFLQARPWLKLEPDDIFAVQVEGEPDPLMVSVTGKDGIDVGFTALRGPHAWHEMHCIVHGRYATDPARAPELALGLCDRDELREPWQRMLKTAGHNRRSAPEIAVLEVDADDVRVPRPDELRLFVYLLQAVLQISRRRALEELRGEGLPKWTCPLVRVTGSLRRPSIDLGLYRGADLADLEDGPDLAARAEALTDAPRLDREYLFGCRRLQDGVFALSLAAICDPEEHATHCHPVLGGDPADAAMMLFDVCAGDVAVFPRGLPRAVVVDDEEIHRTLQPVLSRVGVECIFEPSHPEFAELWEEAGAALEETHAQLMADDADVLGDEAEPEIDPDVVPAPDDLIGWKTLDHSVSERFADAIGPTALTAARAWRRYFGTPPEETPLGSEAEGADLLSYYDWYACDYRAKKGAKTVAEKLLAGDLPAGLRAVLERRAVAIPSLYRIERVVTGESVDLVDVCSGERVTVHDYTMSTRAEIGVIAAMRVYPVGRFHVVSGAGLTLYGHQIEAALAFVESEFGIAFSDPAARTRRGEMIGRLWQWRQQFAARPKMVNTSGDPLRWHEATFRVADPEAAAAALAARPDVERADDGWIWFDVHDGQNRMLGTLELLGDELSLEVNSQARFEAARSWVETIPGVRFERVVDRDPMERRERPLDDRLPSLGSGPELDDEAMAEIEEMMHARYMGWIDERIPALGGRTPREACATEEGRRKVARMIRSYPDPGGIPGISVPREEMLGELGLE